MPPELSLTAVLYLRPLTRSIYLRPYLLPLASRPILAVMAEQVLVRSGARRFVILYHYESERAALEQAVAGTAAELRFTPHKTEIQALAAVAEESEEELIASLQTGMAAAPADLLLRLANHHARHKNPFTLIEGIPSECLVSLYDKTVLLHLAKAIAKTDFYSPEIALRSMLQFGDRKQASQVVPLNGVPFDFLESYQEREDALPQGLFMREKLDYALVEQAVATARENGADPDSAAVLRLVKQLHVKRKAQASQLPRTLQLKLPRRQDARIRVMFMSPPSAFSGAEQAMCSMVKFLDRERFTPLAVIDHDGVFAETLRQMDVEVVCPEREILVQDPERFAYLVGLYRQLRPDIMHLNGRGTLPIVTAAMLFGIPIVQHVRNGDLRGFEDGLAAASSIICITDFLKRETLKYAVRGDRIRIIYDEVDSEYYNPALFDKATCRREFGLDPEAPTVLMIARVVPNKRYDLMLQAAAQLRHRLPNLQLVLKGDVYGDSSYHRKVQELVEKLHLIDCVRWLDFVPDIRPLIATADALVLCSDREGLGSCVVEAQSMAVPVVVTNSGGTHEIVESGVSGGFVIPGNDYGHLTTRLTELLTNEELRTRLGQAGRKYVQERLDARISARAMMEIYEGLMRELK